MPNAWHSYVPTTASPGHCRGHAHVNRMYDEALAEMFPLMEAPMLLLPSTCGDVRVMAATSLTTPSLAPLVLESMRDSRDAISDVVSGVREQITWMLEYTVIYIPARVNQALAGLLSFKN